MKTYHLTVLFGSIAVILLHQHHKLTRTINALDKFVDVVSEYINEDVQKGVDQTFGEITDNFDD